MGAKLDMPRKTTTVSQEQLDDEILKTIRSATYIGTITVRDWVIFGIIAAVVQLIPFYYLQNVMEIYLKQYYLFVPLALICGGALLAYSYGVGMQTFGKKHQTSATVLTQDEYKEEAMRYSMFICNAAYLGLFIVFQWLISFRRIHSKVLAIFLLSGAGTSIVATL